MLQNLSSAAVVIGVLRVKWVLWQTVKNAEFHQGLHYLLRQKCSSENEIHLQFLFEQ